MKTVLKLGIVASVIGLIAIGLQKASNMAGGFQVDILKYGLPKLSSGVITLPIAVKFVNPSPIAINIQQFVADIELFKVSAFQKIAQVNHPLTIAPGESVQIIYAQLSLKDLFAGNLWDFAKSTVSAQSVKIRTNITAVWNGIPIKPEPFLEVITLTSMMNGQSL